MGEKRGERGGRENVGSPIPPLLMTEWRAEDEGREGRKRKKVPHTNL